MSSQKPNRWIKFSNLGFQMMVIISGFTWIGVWLDEKTNYTPLFKIVLPLGGVLGSLLFVIFQVKNMSDE